MSSRNKDIKSSDQAVWVKGETALQHITGKKYKWTLPSPRFQHASCVANEKLYVIGGTQGTAIFGKFNLLSNPSHITLLARFLHCSFVTPSAITSTSTSTLTHTTTSYVIVDDFHVFDPITFTWTEFFRSKNSRVRDGGRAQHTVTYMKADHALFLFGGICKAGIADNTLYMLDLKKDLIRSNERLDANKNTFTWHEVKTSIGQEMPKPRFAHCAVSVCNKLFIFGGQRSGKKLSNTMFRYDPFTSEWSKSLQNQSAKSMAPPAGKDYRMLVIPAAHANVGARHVVVLGTNLNFIYVVPIEKETGHPISWDTLGAVGTIPGAMTSASGQALSPIRRQFAASIVSNVYDVDGKKKKKKKISTSNTSKKSSNNNNDNINDCEIIIFGGIVHNPISALTDEIHSLTINVETGYAKWKELPQRGRSVPSARIGHTFSFVEYKSPQTGLTNHHMLMFGGTDSDAFRQDFFILDLNTPIAKKEVKIHLATLNEIQHPTHIFPKQSDLCAPRGATMTRLWNTETYLKDTKTKSATGTTNTIQTAQFLVLGGSRSSTTATSETSWTLPSHGLIGQYDKPNNMHSSKTIARLLTRDLIKKKKDEKKWILYENLTLMNTQIDELQDCNITTFYGHQTILFPEENMVVVYGGATADDMLLPQGDNAWVLWLGESSQGGLQNWADQGKRQRAVRLQGGSSMIIDPEDGGAKSDRSDKTTTSGTSDTSGGSDSDMGGSTRYHPIGFDLRTNGDDKGNEKKKNAVQHPRNKLHWEMMSVQWPPEDTTEDANGDRIGHACAKYGEWLYIIGGCTTGHAYKADVFRIHVGQLLANGKTFAFQVESPGCTYERCDPTQKYADLCQNMMTPRAGHTVTARGSNFYIYGGGMDGFMVDREMYCFDAETYVWTAVETEGPKPPGRFNHAACMAGGSMANKLIISGGIGNRRPSEEDVKRYTRAKQKNKMTPTPEQFNDLVLADVWTFDLSGKVWSEVGVPDMSPIYGHLMSMYDNRDTKLLLYGGGDTKSSKFQEKGHSFEIDLVPSWSQKHRDGKKRLGNQEKKRSKHIK